MIIAWQGWQMNIPDQWAPVKLEGHHEQGYMLVADLHQPRLGIRWKKNDGRHLNVNALAHKAMAGEIGRVAADELRSDTHVSELWDSPLLFVDDQPPGRDVWVGYSRQSRRLFEIVYHTHHRDQVLVNQVLPSLSEKADASHKKWSIFDLSCTVPTELSLTRHRLNLGDMALMFDGTVQGKKQAACVRQIGPAKLALSRRPLERWIVEQAGWRGPRFKIDGNALKNEDSLHLVQGKIIRRRRFSWMWWMAEGYTFLAHHDHARNKLIIVDATSETLAHEIFESVGWAQTSDEFSENGKEMS